MEHWVTRPPSPASAPLFCRFFSSSSIFITAQWVWFLIIRLSETIYILRLPLGKSSCSVLSLCPNSFQAWMGTRQKRECKSAMSMSDCLAQGRPVRAPWRLGLPLSLSSLKSTSEQSLHTEGSWLLCLLGPPYVLPAHQAALYGSGLSENSQGGWVNSSPITRWQIARWRAMGGGEGKGRDFARGQASQQSV